MQINAAVIDQFFQRLDFSFQNAYRGVPSYWPQVATETGSITEQNVYPFLSMIPGFREWVGPRVIHNVAARGFAVPNKHWEMTFAIDRDKFADDSYGFYNQLMPMIAMQAGEWRDRRLAQVIEAGSSSLCWDGQFFFDTDHPVDPDRASLGTQSNLLTGATYDLTTGDPLVAYGNARAAMAAWLREDNQQMGTIGDLIMVDASMEKYALQVANAVMTAQAIGSAAAGVSNVFMGKPKVLVNPFLPIDATHKRWYLLCTNRGLNPFIWQMREAPQVVTRTALTDENVFKLRQFEWGVDERGEASYTFPFLAFKMQAS